MAASFLASRGGIPRRSLPRRLLCPSRFTLGHVRDGSKELEPNENLVPPRSDKKLKYQIRTAEFWWYEAGVRRATTASCVARPRNEWWSLSRRVGVGSGELAAQSDAPVMADQPEPLVRPAARKLVEGGGQVTPVGDPRCSRGRVCPSAPCRSGRRRCTGTGSRPPGRPGPRRHRRPPWRQHRRGDYRRGSLGGPAPSGAKLMPVENEPTSYDTIFVRDERAVLFAEILSLL